MIRVPGQGPHVPPPPITPKEAKPEEPAATKPAASRETPASIGRGPELDAHSIAVRLAAIATEAKKKEIASEEFNRILEEVIRLTGLANPQDAMEEANRRLQKEIENTITKILENKDLMEEAEAWQNFANLLEHELTQEQVSSFLQLLKDSIKEFV